MRLRYKLAQSAGETIRSAEETVDLDGFPAFASWLQSLGCGTDPPDPRVVSSWADLWRDLAAGKGAGSRIARTRAEGLRFVEIIGKE